MPATTPRVASWPHWYGPNPYLPHLYAALATHGVEHVRHAPLDPEVFTGPESIADFLHLHWVYPLWRDVRTGAPLRKRIGFALETVRAIQDRGTPIVWTVHNLEPHDGFRRGEREAYRTLHREADLCVYHARHTLDAARRSLGTPEGAQVVVLHGASHDDLPAPRPADVVRREEGVAEGCRLLLCYGLVRAYKGFEIAASVVRKSLGPPCHLIIAGRPMDGAMRRVRWAARFSNRVTLIPEMLTAQRLSDLLHAADAVVLPYRRSSGSGVLLQALSTGTGVIASDLPYIREIVAPEPDAAVFFPPGDERALPSAIEAFFSTAVEHRSRAARRLADHLDWETTVQPLADWILARHEAR